MDCDNFFTSNTLGFDSNLDSLIAADYEGGLTLPFSSQSQLSAHDSVGADLSVSGGLGMVDSTCSDMKVDPEIVAEMGFDDLDEIPADILNMNKPSVENTPASTQADGSPYTHSMEVVTEDKHKYHDEQDDDLDDLMGDEAENTTEEVENLDDDIFAQRETNYSPDNISEPEIMTEVGIELGGQENFNHNGNETGNQPEEIVDFNPQILTENVICTKTNEEKASTNLQSDSNKDIETEVFERNNENKTYDKTKPLSKDHKEMNKKVNRIQDLNIANLKEKRLKKLAQKSNKINHESSERTSLKNKKSSSSEDQLVKSKKRKLNDITVESKDIIKSNEKTENHSKKMKLKQDKLDKSAKRTNGDEQIKTEAAAENTLIFAKVFEEKPPLPDDSVDEEKPPLPDDTVIEEKPPLPESVVEEKPPLPEDRVVEEKPPLPNSVEVESEDSIGGDSNPEFTVMEECGSDDQTDTETGGGKPEMMPDGPDPAGESAVEEEDDNDTTLVENGPPDLEDFEVIDADDGDDDDKDGDDVNENTEGITTNDETVETVENADDTSELGETTSETDGKPDETGDSTNNNIGADDQTGDDDDYDDDDDDDDVLDENEVDAWLEEGVEKQDKDQNKEPGLVASTDELGHGKYMMKIKNVLIEKGKNPFESLPEGWISVLHECGMPFYLHKASRVVTLSKPYFIGKGSARRHDTPLSAIPCLHYRRELEKEEQEQAKAAEEAAAKDAAQPEATDTDAVDVIPTPTLATAQSSEKFIGEQEIQDYCKKLFHFKYLPIKRFRTWEEKRSHMKKQMEEKQKNNPRLADNTKLIICPIPGSEGKKMTKKRREFVMNPVNKSPICVLHEYTQHVLRIQPKYIFTEISNQETPYKATMYINDIVYGTGVGSCKKKAKAEAAKKALDVLIPQLSDFWSGPEHRSQDNLSYFDQVSVEDPRVCQLCEKAALPKPFQVLHECLNRNFGLGDTSLKTEKKVISNQRTEFSLSVGKHTVTVTCRNKQQGKQLASQAMLQKLHPHLKSWASILKLYSNHAELAFQEREEEPPQERSIRNFELLEKLKGAMRKTRNLQGQCNASNFSQTEEKKRNLDL